MNKLPDRVKLTPTGEILTLKYVMGMVPYYRSAENPDREVSADLALQAPEIFKPI